MEPVLSKILVVLHYIASHPQEMAAYSALGSVLVALMVASITSRQLRVTLAQLNIATKQVDIGSRQAIAADSAAYAAREAIEQQKRARQTAEETKLNSQAPDLTIIQLGPVRVVVGGHEKWKTSDYDWVFSKENTAALPERFKIGGYGDDDCSWWGLWVAGSLLIRNEGGRTVLLGLGLSHKWVDKTPPKSGDDKFIISPGDEFQLDWFNAYDLHNWRRAAGDDDDRLGVTQRSNTIIVTSAQNPELSDVYSIDYDWYPVYRFPDGDTPKNSHVNFSFARTLPDVHIRQLRCYPRLEEQ